MDTIDFTIIDSPLGRLLVAATDQGVCVVALGDDDAALERTLPRAGVRRDDALAGLARRVAAGDPDVPLDVRGTPFQWRVWRALQAIPAGETRTYREIAEAVGRPAAVRAVGAACGANPVALMIPCHRAVRTDGGLGGYRWGLERKAALLGSEAAGEAAAGDEARRAEAGGR